MAKARGTGSGTGGAEPWFVRNTSTEATLNTQNIYQKRNVAEPIRESELFI